MTRKWLILCSLSTPDEERKRGKENGRRSKSIQLGLTSLRLSVGHEGTPYNNGCYQPHDYQKEREREREREREKRNLVYRLRAIYLNVRCSAPIRPT